MQRLFVRTGYDKNAKRFVLDIVEKAGYSTDWAKEHINDAGAFRFEEDSSGFCSDADAGCYDPSSGDYGPGVLFDIRTQLGAFLEYIVQAKTEISLLVSGNREVVKFSSNGNITIGCTTVASKKFEEIAAQRAKVLSSNTKKVAG